MQRNVKQKKDPPADVDKKATGGWLLASPTEGLAMGGNLRAFQALQPSGRARKAQFGMVCRRTGTRHQATEDMVILGITVAEDQPKTPSSVCIWSCNLDKLDSDPTPSRWAALPPTQRMLTAEEMTIATTNFQRWSLLVKADPEAYRTAAFAALALDESSRGTRTDAVC